MKQHLYILSFSLILFVSIIYLNEHSVQCAGKGSDKQSLYIQKFTTGKWSPEDATEYYRWGTVIHSAKAPLPDGIPVRKDTHLSGLFLYKFLSDPALIDLPPPALQI